MVPYVTFVHTLQCVLSGKECRGAIEANHAGRKPGMGLKAPDDTCVPMCQRHHAEWTEHRGYFSGLDKDERTELAGRWVDATRLAAIPEDFDQALEFAEMGLGRIAHDAEGRWNWTPIYADPQLNHKEPTT